MSITTQMEYMRLKHQQKSEEQAKLLRGKEQLYNRISGGAKIGLGNGYTLDMKDALKQVNDFDYTPTEAEIHYRRYTSGQWTDKSK